LGVGVIVLFSIPVGLLLRLEVGIYLAAVLWVFVLLGGLISAVLLLGLVFGWPLMWGTISAEEMGDVFEASQRCYSYTFGRPLRYLFYILVALLIGSAGWVLVYYFAEAVLHLSGWAVSWGSGSERLARLDGSSGAHLAASVIQALNGLVRSVASAYRYSFLWCAAASIYLLLRRDVDHTEMDDIYVEDEQKRYGLPPLPGGERDDLATPEKAGEGDADDS
jgi:hypothetical protein